MGQPRQIITICYYEPGETGWALCGLINGHSLCLSVSQSASLSVCLSVSQQVCVSVCLSVSLSHSSMFVKTTEQIELVLGIEVYRRPVLHKGLWICQNKDTFCRNNSTETLDLAVFRCCYCFCISASSFNHHKGCLSMQTICDSDKNVISQFAVLENTTTTTATTTTTTTPSATAREINLTSNLLRFKHVQYNSPWFDRKWFSATPQPLGLHYLPKYQVWCTYHIRTPWVSHIGGTMWLSDVPTRSNGDIPRIISRLRIEIRSRDML